VLPILTSLQDGLASAEHRISPVGLLPFGATQAEHAYSHADLADALDPSAYSDVVPYLFAELALNDPFPERALLSRAEAIWSIV
jgi:hypothetical protein